MKWIFGKFENKIHSHIKHMQCILCQRSLTDYSKINSYKLTIGIFDITIHLLCFNSNHVLSLFQQWHSFRWNKQPNKMQCNITKAETNILLH